MSTSSQPRRQDGARTRRDSVQATPDRDWTNHTLAAPAFPALLGLVCTSSLSPWAGNSGGRGGRETREKSRELAWMYAQAFFLLLLLLFRPSELLRCLSQIHHVCPTLCSKHGSTRSMIMYLFPQILAQVLSDTAVVHRGYGYLPWTLGERPDARFYAPVSTIQCFSEATNIQGPLLGNKCMLPAKNECNVRSNPHPESGLS